jgi:hypothetical protein
MLVVVQVVRLVRVVLAVRVAQVLRLVLRQRLPLTRPRRRPGLSK